MTQEETQTLLDDIQVTSAMLCVMLEKLYGGETKNAFNRFIKECFQEAAAKWHAS